MGLFTFSIAVSDVHWNITRKNMKLKVIFLFQSILSPRFKNSGKYGSGLSFHWALFTAWAFWFKLHFIFCRVELKKRFNILFGDFHGRNWRIPGFYENNTQHWALFSTKTNQGRVIFIGPSSLSRFEELAAVNHVTQAVVRVGPKIES